MIHQLQAQGLQPIKCGVKKRIIKRLQSQRCRSWQKRFVLHPGAGHDSTYGGATDSPLGTWLPRYTTQQLFSNNLVADQQATVIQSTDLLSAKELELLRRMQAEEIIDYAKGFYQSDFLNSISTVYRCDQCEKEYAELTSLRKHITLKHGASGAQHEIAFQSTVASTPVR